MKALITGITGQDGSYLTEFLLNKGYEVHGLVRRASTSNIERLKHLLKKENVLYSRLFLHYGDVSESETINKLINQIKPNEIYHLAAQSHVKISFDMPEYTANVTGLSCLRILEAIKNSGIQIKLYQASSSEMFGSSPPPQNENTPFNPVSPYAVAKVFAHHNILNYRNAYGIFACSGILFNHESPRRGDIFVTRKITKGTASIKSGLSKKLFMGNVDTKRDWGYSPDYVEAMWLMMQQKIPDDYVIATGESHTVRDFLEEAFIRADLGDYKNYVEIDSNNFRPVETAELRGDYSKAKEKLGWEPKVKFKDLVKIMVESDLKEI